MHAVDQATRFYSYLGIRALQFPLVRSPPQSSPLGFLDNTVGASKSKPKLQTPLSHSLTHMQVLQGKRGDLFLAVPVGAMQGGRWAWDACTRALNVNECGNQVLWQGGDCNSFLIRRSVSWNIPSSIHFVKWILSPTLSPFPAISHLFANELYRDASWFSPLCCDVRTHCSSVWWWPDL